MVREIIIMRVTVTVTIGRDLFGPLLWGLIDDNGGTNVSGNSCDKQPIAALDKRS